MTIDWNQGFGTTMMRIAEALERIADNNHKSGAEVVARLLEIDPHAFSTRPCQTCTTVTAVLGRDYGCVARRARPSREGK